MSENKGSLGKLKARAEASKHKEAPTVQISVDLLDFDPLQPRIAFHAVDGRVEQSDQEALEVLAASIEAHGLIHPIIVQEQPNGRYLVRVGERRSRAMKLLGKPTIKAQIRNELTGMKALALQVAENTDREELTDRELAATVKRFVTKSEENPTPMTKKEVSELMGKSPSWVTRYLNFSNEELTRKWIDTGYLNGVEQLYQMSTLPDKIQELAYAELSTGVKETPLSWSALQYYRSLARNAAAAAAAATEAEASGREAAAPTTKSATIVPGSPEQVAAIAAAMANASEDGVVPGLGEQVPVSNSVPPAGTIGDNRDGGYSLAPEMVDDLRVPTYTAGGSEPSTLGTTRRIMAATAVTCKMPVRQLNNLMTRYGNNIVGFEKVEAEFRIPSAAAVDLVRELTGETVEEDRVQVMLAKALAALSE